MDFTNLPRKNKTYNGANGKKISVVIDGEQYMIKFPVLPSINQKMSYSNGCVSEYLGSHIFNMLGVKAQETILGTFLVDGKEKIVVGCKDFTTQDTILQDFASLKNTIIESESNGYGTELSDVLSTIEEQQAINSITLKEHFWDVFIIDALIGNWDRHNGNWGFLYNIKTDSLEIAPVFDCGSSLYPQADDDVMKLVFEDQSEKDFRIFQIPTSGLKINNQKINYFNFISSLEYDDCNEALKRITSRINLEEINKLIEDTPYISDLQKDFYKMMIRERKEKILDKSLKMLQSK